MTWSATHFWCRSLQLCSLHHFVFGAQLSYHTNHTAPRLKMAASKPAAPTLGPKELYLILYNALCCLGWAYVLALGIPSVFNSVTSSDASLLDALKNAGNEMYFATPATAGWSAESSPSLAVVLKFVQSAALFEIVHAAMGLVRSPVFVTAMQVGSRIVALHMVNVSPKAQCKFHAIGVSLATVRNFTLTTFCAVTHVICFFVWYSSMGSCTHDPLLGPC